MVGRHFVYFGFQNCTATSKRFFGPALFTHIKSRKMAYKHQNIKIWLRSINKMSEVVSLKQISLICWISFYVLQQQQHDSDMILHLLWYFHWIQWLTSEQSHESLHLKALDFSMPSLSGYTLEIVSTQDYQETYKKCPEWGAWSKTINDCRLRINNGQNWFLNLEIINRENRYLLSKLALDVFRYVFGE